MTASKGFFELEADDMHALSEALESWGKFKKVALKGHKIKAYIDHDVTAAELNKYLVSKSIYLTHLVKSKESLENQFLDLVKQN